jgi:hypothetical protein
MTVCHPFWLMSVSLIVCEEHLCAAATAAVPGAAATARLEFEQNPDAFLEKVRPDQEALTQKLVDARKRLTKCVQKLIC